MIACSVARILSSWREGDDRRERKERGTPSSPAHAGALHWPGRPMSRRPSRAPIGARASFLSGRAGGGPSAAGREGGRDGGEGEGGSPAPLQSLLGSHLELLCALQKCPLLHSSSPLLSLPSSRGVEDPHCVEDVRHHRGRRRRGLLQQHEERRRRLQRQQDISDIKNDYHCSSTARTDGERARAGDERAAILFILRAIIRKWCRRERERFRKSKYAALQME